MHNDSGRTGRNLEERILNTHNVNMRGFGRLFAREVDGAVLAQPLVVSNVRIRRRARANLVYVATEHNSVYAYDAENPSRSAPVWRRNLGPPVPSADVSYDYHDLAPDIGITGTPVIDDVTHTMYVVAKTKNPADGTYHQTLHALDIATGSEKLGGPVEIRGAVEGNSADGQDGVVSFDPLRELNRAGLLLSNGVVYVAFGSHADHSPYHGWVMGYDARTLKQVAIMNTSPDGAMAGIWQAGQAPASDSAHNIYVVTGNGTFSGNRPGGRDFGQCLLRLSPDGLQVTGWYSPGNAAELDKYDVDLGAGGPLLIPGTKLIAVAGKDGVLRILDRDQFGRTDGSAGPTTEFEATNRYLGAPVYWDSSDRGSLIYMWGDGDCLKAFKVSNGHVEASPAMRGTEISPVGLSNTAPLSLSADGSARGTGIIWATCPVGGDANWQSVPGVLRAFDASDLSRELWNSRQNHARDDYGLFSRFCPPTIANGKVYVASSSCQLVVFGQLKTRWHRQHRKSGDRVGLPAPVSDRLLILSLANS
jgi:hypothetical protein